MDQKVGDFSQAFDGNLFFGSVGWNHSCWSIVRQHALLDTGKERPTYGPMNHLDCQETMQMPLILTSISLGHDDDTIASQHRLA